MAAQKKAAQEQVEEQDPDKRDDPTRCGGYTLTNEGWVLDTPDEN